MNLKCMAKIMNEIKEYISFVLNNEKRENIPYFRMLK